MSLNLFDSVPIELTKFISEFCEPETQLIFSVTCNTFYRQFYTKVETNTITIFCAENGFLNLLKWIYLDTYHCCPQILFTATAKGDLEMLQWCIAHYHKILTREDWTEYLNTQAAINGHLHILKWLKEEGCPWNKSRCLAHAKLNG